MEHLILAIGIVLTFIGAGRLMPYLRARKWVEQDAEIVAITEASSEIRMRYGSFKCYYPIIRYTYRINGISRVADKVSFEKENIWQPEIDMLGNRREKRGYFWSGWQSGSTIPIFVDLKNPENAVVVKDLGNERRSHHLSLLTAGLLLMAIWVALLVLS